MGDFVIVNEGDGQASAGCIDDGFLYSGFDFEDFFRGRMFKA